jgi:hypothetical protein
MHERVLFIIPHEGRDDVGLSSRLNALKLNLRYHLFPVIPDQEEYRIFP